MKKNNEWAITFDVMKKDKGDESTEVYHNLEQELGTFLQEKFGNCEFVEDSPEGEEYTVRFKVFSDENPDKEDLMLGPFIIDNGLWEVVGLDIKEFKEVYIDEYFIISFNCLSPICAAKLPRSLTSSISSMTSLGKKPSSTDLFFNLFQCTSSPGSKGFGTLYSYVSLLVLFPAQTHAR